MEISKEKIYMCLERLLSNDELIWQEVILKGWVVFNAGS